MTDEGTRRVQRVLLVTLVLNLIVAGLKLALGTLTHTLSVRADGFHSLTDGSSNVLGLLGIWWARRPPDGKHPYGHDRIEVLASIIVGVSLLLVAWDVVQGAVGRISGADVPDPPGAGLWFVLSLTLCINVFVVLYERRAAKRCRSSFLESDAAHTFSDVLVTLSVVVTVWCIQLGQAWVDWLSAFVIAGVILAVGLRVLWRNLDYLMDAAQVAEATVSAVARRVPGVAGSHRIRTRGVPGAVRIDLHIQIAPHLNVVQAHEVTHWVIDALNREIPGVHDVVVHTEPARAGDPYPDLPERMLPAAAPRPACVGNGATSAEG